MHKMSGYIYIRRHESYDKYNACKLGKTTNIPDRDNTYITGEVKRGCFVAVYKITRNLLNVTERLLQRDFTQYHVKETGGNEFYDIKIINLIEQQLIVNNIKFTKLTSEEINTLTRINRVKQTLSKINIRSLITALKSTTYIPRDYQTTIINNGVSHFNQFDKGLLVLMCGMGKILISLWIAQKINANTILIGVPNILLLRQWKDVVDALFPVFECLPVFEGVSDERIIRFLSSNLNKHIIITTYSSSHKIYTATHMNNIGFDLMINDECHHLTSGNIDKNGNTYVNMLKIKSNKQLSLTATLKIIENDKKKRDEDIVVSNDNVNYFGEIIDKRSLIWAINNNIICDYAIQIIVTKEEQLTTDFIIEENEKRLFLSAFSALKSIINKNTHHLLIYSNSMHNSGIIIKYIKELLNENYFHLPNLYYSNYNSDMSISHQKEIIYNFRHAPCGIISCVYCLGEGWDFPLLDGVVFAENMTSNIRIIQSALRACRKNNYDVNKETKIILPIFNNSNENTDLKKVKEVIYQMGIEDETICHKIKAYDIEVGKHSEGGGMSDFNTYNNELTEQLKLKTIKRLEFVVTFEKAKKIIMNENVKTKEEYYCLCDKNIKLPKEPDMVYKGKFTGWIDYLGIERIYYDFHTCKTKVNEYLNQHRDLRSNHSDLVKVVKKLCNFDALFPPYDLWIEYYNISYLSDIIIINSHKKKRGLR